MMDILTWTFGLASVAGLALTLHFGRKSIRLERAMQTLSWEDVVVAADDLGASISKTGFQPEMFLATSVRGGIIAHFMSRHLAPTSPVLVGIVEWKGEDLFHGDLSTYDTIDTSKVRLYIPKAVYANSERRVLVVDDFTMSGDGMAETRARLINHGFRPDAVRTATLIVSTVALARHRGPDHYWKKVDSLDFFFPWGRAK